MTLREVECFGGGMDGRVVTVGDDADRLYSLSVLLVPDENRSYVYESTYRLDDKGFQFVKIEEVAT